MEEASDDVADALDEDTGDWEGKTVDDDCELAAPNPDETEDIAEAVDIADADIDDWEGFISAAAKEGVAEAPEYDTDTEERPVLATVDWVETSVVEEDTASTFAAAKDELAEGVAEGIAETKRSEGKDADCEACEDTPEDELD